MMNRVEKCMVAARRVWGFIWKECTGFRAPYYSWHPEMPCVHIITTLNWGIFLPFFFPSSSPRKFLFGLREEAVLLKEGQWLSGGPGLWWVMRYQRLHCLGGRCSSAAPCRGLVVSERSVCDPGLLFFFFFYRSQWRDIIDTQINMAVFVQGS